MTLILPRLITLSLVNDRRLTIKVLYVHGRVLLFLGLGLSSQFQQLRRQTLRSSRLNRTEDILLQPPVVRLPRTRPRTFGHVECERPTRRLGGSCVGGRPRS